MQLPPLNPSEVADILETEPIWDGDGLSIWDDVKIVDEQGQEASGAQNITQPSLATYAGASPEANASSENFEAQQLEEQNTSKRKPTGALPNLKTFKLSDFDSGNAILPEVETFRIPFLVYCSAS